MTEGEERLKKRLRELAERADARGVYTFSPFLSEPEQALLSALGRLPAPPALFGGAEDCERKMARFGSPELFGYDASFPIACVQIRPRGQRFSEELTHRDFLGALLHLGLSREALGDIALTEGGAFVFCTEPAAALIESELGTVRHTRVDAARCEAPERAAAQEMTRQIVQVQSERLDALVARACRLPREKAQQLFAEGRVFQNGAAAEGSSLAAEGDLLSVRGYGRFRYLGVQGRSRKGRKNVAIEKSWS